MANHVKFKEELKRKFFFLNPNFSNSKLKTKLLIFTLFKSRFEGYDSINDFITCIVVFLVRDIFKNSQ